MQALLQEQLFSRSRLYNGGMPGGRPATRPQPEFGQRLTALRKERGLSQNQLAKLIGASREVVSYYERRATNPTAEFLEKISKLFEISVGELLGEEPAKACRKPGRVSQLEARFEAARQLPKQRQKFIIDFVDTVLRDANVNCKTNG